MGNFWGLLDAVEPTLTTWPLADLVRLVENPDSANDPVAHVERTLGRALTVEERGMVMLKVLAPGDLRTPSDELRHSFVRAAEQEEPWAAAICAGALGA